MSHIDLRYVAGDPVARFTPVPDWHIVPGSPAPIVRVVWRQRGLAWLARMRMGRLHLASALAYGDERKIEFWRRMVLEQRAACRSCRDLCGPVLP